ncbi:MAG: glycosyltransferase, partial [Bacteroidota bacterium]
MDLSIVIPLYNEEESLPELEAWINKVATAHQFDYEIVMVD